MRISKLKRREHISEFVPIEKKKIKSEAVCGYIFVLLPILAYVVFNIFPLLISFTIQFFSMEGYNLSTLEWNNFQNFKDVFTDSDFYLSLGVSLFMSRGQFISLIVALFMSVLLSKKIAGHKFFQIIYFIPYICSSVAVSLMWMWMFDPDYGIINSIIELVAGPAARVAWFKDQNAYPWMIIIATVWQAPGYGIVLYKAALDQVNPSLYEASSIDGASAWKKFWNITFPSIAPTTFFLLMSGIMAGLQTFDMAKLFAQTGNTWLGEAGPNNIGLTTVLYIYNWGTNYQNMPRASVMSWVLFYIIFIISAINFKLRRKWVDE